MRIDYDLLEFRRIEQNKENRRRRIRKAKAIGTHTDEEWENLKKEFGYRCVKCFKEGVTLEKDHIIPIYREDLDPSDLISNIQPLCVNCNRAKGPNMTNWVKFRRMIFAKLGVFHA